MSSPRTPISSDQIGKACLATDSSMKAFYEEHFDFSYLELVGWNSYLRFIEKYLPKNRAISILDAGCGVGAYSNYLYQSGYQNILAVDLFDRIQAKIPYKRGEIENIPCEDDSVDFAMSFGVVCYAKDASQACDELIRVLKPGGVLILSSHTKYSLYTLKRCIQRSLVPKRVRHLKGVRFYSTYFYAHRLRKAGFELIELAPWGDWASKSLRQLLGDEFGSLPWERWRSHALWEHKGKNRQFPFWKYMWAEASYYFVMVVRKPGELSEDNG